mmetsp:Transcript_30939/g.66972  ORF Transcript_30939/g.66972 Transcript_30939/m.66972 type:complete len:110 (+) Transcript_30939:83-412(+)
MMIDSASVTSMAHSFSRSSSSSSAADFLSDDSSLSSASPTRRQQMTNIRRGTRSRNPIVSAMLSSNNMTDCHQVKDLYSKCQDDGSRSSSMMICDTAQKLFVSCHMSEK